MTTNYPGSLDSFTNPTATDTLATANGSTAVPHASQHANLNDAVLAIQTKLGTTSTKASFPAGITIPVAPTTSTDAVNKSYVDGLAAGVNVHDAVKLATTVALTGATYAQITSGGVDSTGGYGPGSTLTVTPTTQSIDGTIISTLSVNDRILIKNQATATQNGLYSVTTLSPFVLTRTSDADNNIYGEVAPGDMVYVISGTANAGNAYVMNTVGTGTNGTIKIGTDNINWTQYTGALSGSQIVSLIGTTPVTNATNVGNTTTTSSSTFYINFGSTNTTVSQGTNTNASLTYVPSTGTLSASVISGGALGGSLLSSTSGSALGTAGAGTSTIPARADHVHPTTGLVTTFAGGTTGLTPASATSGAISLAGTLVVANGGTGTGTAGITAFNNITGYTASGATGTTSTNLVFSASPTFTGTVTVPNTGIVYPGSTSGQSILSAPAIAGTNTAIVLPSTAGTLVISASPTLTTPKIDSIVTNTGAAAAATLFGDVTSGSITIGSTLAGGTINVANSITTGGVNIAATGTGATPIAIGHTNATISLTGATTFAGGTTILTTGTNTIAPLKFVGGPVLTTPVVGSVEFDGDTFWLTPNASATAGRGFVSAPAWVFSNTNSGAVTTNTSVPIFQTGARTITLEANKNYYFKLNLNIIATFTSGTATINFVPTFTQTPQSINYTALYVPGTAGNSQSFRVSTTTATAISPAITATQTNAGIIIEGYIQTNATTGGTLTFNLQMSTTGTSTVVTNGSYQQVMKLGSGTAVPATISGIWA
jgi:hypothetical protein